ncbi:Lipocalin-like domain-containing protein [Algoriphagus locisalis]|uniref:Lipocalin-like domain-containing protein n=1 Tax=Algoriphagus locisalis TaxID=305507 RepID=A0A1I7E6G7_9BACT|nr:lipocalin family protein [Algoriphagus locisalis]SFU19524.1 Lipocalin-like domain-containing protein [Algoriphagus locisalis]
MKTNFIIGLCLVFTLFSCTEEDPLPFNELHGTWVLTTEVEDPIVSENVSTLFSYISGFVFSADNSGSVVFTNKLIEGPTETNPSQTVKSITTENIPITWNTDQNKLMVKATSTDETLVEYSYSISDNTLTFLDMKFQKQ